MRIVIALTLTSLALLLPAIAAGQEWRTITSSRAMSGEDLLHVDLEYGAGRLDIGPGSAGTLYRANVRYDAHAFTPRVNFRDNRLQIDVEGNEVKGKVKSGNLDLRLSPNVPLNLELKFGAVEANIDFTGLRVRRSEISTGASKTTLRVTRPNQERCERFALHVGAAAFHAIGLGNLNVEHLSVEGGVGEVLLDFTGEWRADMHADVQMGLGALTLRVPRGLGLRVQKKGFLASFDSQELIKRGDAYFSENWDEADQKLTVDLQAALGSIKVVWVN
jgi:hypothetical protein